MKKRIVSLALLMFITIGIIFMGGQASPQGVVLAASGEACSNRITAKIDNLKIKTNNGQADLLEILKQGNVADVLSQLGNWYTIKAGDGYIGKILKWCV
jgi:SH3-like domain-containing protein